MNEDDPIRPKVGEIFRIVSDEKWLWHHGVAVELAGKLVEVKDAGFLTSYCQYVGTNTWQRLDHDVLERANPLELLAEMSE